MNTSLEMPFPSRSLSLASTSSASRADRNMRSSLGVMISQNGWGAAQTSPLIDVRYQARPRSGRSCQHAGPARSPLALQPGPV